MAENQEGQEKSEAPSQKRLTDAANRGQRSKSMDVTTAALILPGGAMIYFLGKNTIAAIMNLMRETFQHPLSFKLTDSGVAEIFTSIVELLAKIALPLSLTLFALGLAAEISQVGFKLASEKFTKGLNWKQIANPFSGVKRIFFSSRSLFELIKSLCKVALLGLIAYNVLSKKADEVFSLVQRPFMDYGIFIANAAFELFYKVGLVYALIAAGDFAYQKFKYIQDLKMTKQEVKEETKQTEGDPKVKAKFKGLMLGRLRRMMLQKTKTADVVITNPTHFAIAVKYDSGKMQAPIVVAKGADFLAKQIREIAREANVPIVEDPPLARTLYANVEVDSEIPEDLYKAVAQVLAFVYQLKNKAN